MTPHKILVINAGGTIGMIQTNYGFATKKGNIIKLLKRSSRLNVERCENSVKMDQHETKFHYGGVNIKNLPHSQNCRYDGSLCFQKCDSNRTQYLSDLYGSTADTKYDKKHLSDSRCASVFHESAFNSYSDDPCLCSFIKTKNLVSNCDVQTHKSEMFFQNHFSIEGSKHDEKHISLKYDEDSNDQCVSNEIESSNFRAGSVDRNFFQRIRIPIQNNQSTLYPCYPQRKCFQGIQTKENLEGCKLTAQYNDVLIEYQIVELNDIIDSSDATFEYWIEIMKLIENFYREFSGFVILHGTDTMAYACSFLHTMISNLSKPIVFTGSMKPMVVKFKEGESNLLGALYVASSNIKPGVYLFFKRKIHKGKKVTKFSSHEYDAFWSKKPIALKSIGTKLDQKIENYNKLPIFNYNYEDRVTIIKLHPNISNHIISCILKNSRGVVLETYGTGNGLSNNSEALKLFKEFIESGGIILNISQCIDQRINNDYVASNGLACCGILRCSKMTTEYALCHLTKILARNDKNLFYCSNNQIII